MQPRTVTAEYVRFSLLCGWYATAIHHATGDPSIIQYTRFNAWAITPELLVILESVGLSVGVPPESFLMAQLIADDFVSDPNAMRVAQALQTAADTHPKKERLQ